MVLSHVQVAGALVVSGAVFGVVGYACYLSWKAQKEAEEQESKLPRKGV